MDRCTVVGGAVGKGILVVAIVLALALVGGCSRDSDSSSAGSAGDGALFRNLGKR